MLSVRTVGRTITSRISSSRERGSWHRCLWGKESGMCCIEDLLIGCLWIIFSYYIRKSRSGRRWGLGNSIRCQIEYNLDHERLLVICKCSQCPFIHLLISFKSKSTTFTSQSQQPGRSSIDGICPRISTFHQNPQHLPP